MSGVFTHGRPETEDAEALVGVFLQFQPHRVRIGMQTWLEITEQVFASEMHAVHECAASAATAGELRYAAPFNYTGLSRLRGGFHRKCTERLRARQHPPI
ncbi:hypothetical protein [Salinispora sp. H7-4]|uniref:hypothetical protein n=1 Tax=Salinispora sp. H7-4 TaxID=2748321 RepID=UPI002104EA50|nr:hypothetical protein [Salinispora sp. H7-4]